MTPELNDWLLHSDPIEPDDDVPTIAEAFLTFDARVQELLALIDGMQVADGPTPFDAEE